MKIALTGFFNSGKTTIFNALTHQKIETSLYPTPAETVHKGIFYVDDPRLKKISELVNPKKITPVTIECIDPAGLTDSSVHNSKIFKELINADAVVYILRGFEDLSVPYRFETVDPVRDLNEIDYEVILSDLELVSKRIEKMTEQKKKGQKINEKEMEVLEFLRGYLEGGKPLRKLNLTEETLREIRHLSFLSLKPFLSIINADENSFKENRFKDTGILTVCGLLEMELCELSEEDINSFASVMGIQELLTRKITEKIYQTLNCISFFTIVSGEVRAWSIKKGTKAVEAAGKIHSDIQRGFIKAEVISYNEFVSVDGDISLARNKGILRLEGKEYEIKDGEIITFRFKV